MKLYHSDPKLTVSSISNPTTALHDYLVMMDSGYKQVCVIGVLSKPEVKSCSIACLLIRSFGYKRLYMQTPPSNHTDTLQNILEANSVKPVVLRC
jgi:hypothetical protein